jgi:thymidylate synthase (FAD)
MKIVEQSVKILKPDNLSGGIKMLQAIEYAGRNCYRSHHKMDGASYAPFIKSLLSRKHYSPLEFGDITVELVTGRDVMSEITRHRLASFCIQSQRYVLENKEGDIHFIKPLFYTKEPTAKGYASTCVWEKNMALQEIAYKDMITCGCKPQDARKVLGNSVATVIVMKANVREWLHVLELRDSPAAYPEMQDLMRTLRKELQKVVPFVFDEEEGNGSAE